MILSKLKGPYHVFSSSFYSTMDALGDQFKLPTFEVFCERLVREKSKLQQLDALSSSQAIAAHTSKGKTKSHPQKKKDSDKGSEPPSKLNRNQSLLHTLPSLKSLPPRQVRRSQMNLAAFVEKKGIQNPSVTRNLKH